ncbi:MAG: tRNA 4-thiouridine(8) synthase ThiI [Acidobacteria bacterium]|nr:tRNA 4-thiouridine(8) synthase ThiI [Acidobacteriota bacterium]
MMRRVWVIHYHEIGLKRKNRPFFERRLQQNVQQALSDLQARCERVSGRLLARLPDGASAGDLAARLKTVFGVVYFAEARECGQQIEEIQPLLEEDFQRDFTTFRIHARRSEKNLPLTSQQINQILGAYVVGRTGKKVDLTHPDLTFFVELVQGRAYVYTDRVEGPHGMPTSTGGKVVAMLSGGIDSPVACYRVMKRGCRLVFVHFHSFPFTTRQSQEKVEQIVRILNRYQEKSRVYWVAFAEIQKKIMALAPPEARVLFYRRIMIGIAERIARRERAQALVTGESIGQVASQTLENIRVINEGIGLPVLRPLIGHDKEEIIELARHIGTYSISILPDQDCCSLFVPRHPETRATRRYMEMAGRELDQDALIEQGVQSCKRQLIGERG